MSEQSIEDILDDWEHEVTRTPKHWKKSPERQAIDDKYKAQLRQIVEDGFDEVVGGPYAHSCTFTPHVPCVGCEKEAQPRRKQEIIERMFGNE